MRKVPEPSSLIKESQSEPSMQQSVGFGSAENLDQDEFDRGMSLLTPEQNREFGRQLARLFLEKRAARQSQKM